nr:uncharacterized protein LOC101240705 [Hydra vulgaris]
MVFKKDRYLCTTVFVANVSIILVCINLIFLIIVISLNTWYKRVNDVSIKFWYGGLWSECMGESERTFCSPLTNIPRWLLVSQVLCLISLISLFTNIVYIMIAMARKKLKITILMLFTHITTISLLIATLIYSFEGFSSNTKPYSTYFLAWVTIFLQLLASVMCTYSLLRVSKEDKKHAIINGITC